jgi:hypothetical protein
MNAMSCAEVQEQLDLLAADACEPATRTALEDHLRTCSTCAARFAESQRLLGLLDVHFGEKGLKRLQARIAEQGRPRRRLLKPFVRGILAAAALVLIAVGLAWWLPNWNGDNDAEPSFALVVQKRTARIVPGGDKLPELPKDKLMEVLAARGGKQLREELAQAQRDGKLPPPPAVALDLVLTNTGQHPVEVKLGEATPMLEIDLPGDAVVRVPAPTAAEPDFLRPLSFRLEPGQEHAIHIDRLVAGSPGKLEYIYVTEPGAYTLTARIRFLVEGKTVTVAGPPVRLTFGK